MTIAPEHEQQILLPRGISATQAERFGVKSIASPDELPKEFENNRYAVGTGLLFTWHSPLTGTVLQFRPDEPAINEHGDPVKYVFPLGTGMVLNRLRDNSAGTDVNEDHSVSRPPDPVLLQEGTMQSLAAAIYAPPEWAVYGMSGCWSWRKGDTQVATPDLLVVEGRSVVVSLDADAATNLSVYDAGMALKDALENEGATDIRFLRLDGHGAKAGIDDVLGARPESARQSYLARLLERAEEKPAKTKPAKRNRQASGEQAPRFAPTADRPMIMVNDDRREVINQMTDALHRRWNSTGLFNYGGILAQRQGADVKPVTEGVFADLIAEAALCATVNAKGEALPGWPDDKSCKATLSRADRFARLDRIVRVPFVREDGTVCQENGYDADSATYLAMDESMSTVTVPETPSEDDVASAVKLLCDEWLGDLMAIMPQPEDRANCLAMMLTPLIRGLVPLAPLAVVDGLQMGVGKNLLADLLSIFATGDVANPLPFSRDDEENRKLITSLFRAGQEIIVFDEAHVIEGKNLARSITGITYSDRILGVSNMIAYPNRATWVALGNNVSVNEDLARRVYRIRLAPTAANPQDRDVSSYRHPDIKGWTRRHRHELVGAALTLVRAWLIDPDRQENVNGRRFGSFEPWGGMVGGILDAAGVPGFLDSLVEWRSETDYVSSFWSQHLSWLQTQFNGTEFTVAEVVKKMRSAQHGSVEHPPRLEDHTVVGYNRLLGLAYKRIKNRYIAGKQLVKTREINGHGSWWTVRDLDGGKDETLPEPTQAADLSNQETPRSEPMLVTLEPYPTHTKNAVYTSRNTYVHENPSSGTAPANKLASPNSPLPGVYPLYPHYPATDGADPLDSLISLAVDVPAPECPDCDQPEELVPGAHWFACPRCHSGTFSSRG